MLGKEVFFIENGCVVVGIITEVCENKRNKKYVAMFFDEEGNTQERVLIDNKYVNDVFGFTYEEFIAKVKEKTQEVKDDLKQLRKEYENL